MALMTQAVTLAVPTSAAAAAGISCYGLHRKTVTLESAGTATYQLQISLADPTGSVPATGDTSWVNYGSALTASGIVEVTAPACWMRWNCTAYTSGSPSSKMLGEVSYSAGG